jgi:hypothetical protein
MNDAMPVPKTVPNRDAIEKNEKPFDRSSFETISPINENILGITAPYPIPVNIVVVKNRRYPINPTGINITNKENNEKSSDPINTINFLTILSARYPNMSILIPVKIIKQKVKNPRGAVSPPNPK